MKGKIILRWLLLFICILVAVLLAAVSEVKFRYIRLAAISVIIVAINEWIETA